MRRILIFVFLSLAINLSAQDITIDQLLDRFESTIKIPNLTGTLSVKLISANGDSREIRANAYQKQIGEDQINRLFLFDHPPSVRDTGFLIHSFLNGDENVMWIYLPAVRRVKRIALSTSGDGYFMGSDFSYSDFIAKSRDGFDREIIGEVILDNTPCYLVRESGKTRAQRQDTGLSYMMSYFRKDDYLMLGRDSYDLAGELLKEYRVKEVIILGQYIYPTVIEMENVQTGHRSIIEIVDVSTDEIPDRYFTSRFLQNR